MSDETKTEVTETQTQEEKFVPQSEVDRIVSQRLEREKSKYSDYEDLKQKAETLEAKIKEREEAELTENEKLKKQLEETNTELESHKKNTEWRNAWETSETEAINKLMEELEVAEDEQELINSLPLEKRKTAIQKFKTSSEKPSPGTEKGKPRGTKYSQEDLFDLKRKYGAGSREYLDALKIYMSN